MNALPRRAMVAARTWWVVVLIASGCSLATEKRPTGNSEYFDACQQ